MTEPLVSDALWALIAPLLPERPPRPKGGRPPLDDRKALEGVVFVLRTGIPGRACPGDGLRLRHDLLAPAARLAGGRGLRAAPPRAARPARPGERDRLRPLLARQRLVPGEKGGELTGPNPTDRGKPAPSATSWSTRRHPARAPAQRRERPRQPPLEPLLDAVPPVRQCAGRPAKRPGKLHADKGYDYDRCRKAARRRGITPRIARRGVENSERLGRHRWVVERTLAWFARFRRLAVRHERRLDVLLAFHLLAAGLICFGFVRRWCL
jgi:transposase